jgi:hypothetical protein
MALYSSRLPLRLLADRNDMMKSNDITREGIERWKWVSANVIKLRICHVSSGAVGAKAR